MKSIICFVAVLFVVNSNSVFAQSDNVVKYETKEYKIIFPGEPKRITQNLQSEFGPLFMTMVMYEPAANNDNYIYMIAETDYPDSSIHSDKTEILDKYFREAIAGAVKNVNGELIKVVPGHVGKYPSRLIEIDYKKGLAVIKLAFVVCKNKVISIQTITETKKYSNPSIDKFFASFVLKTN